MPFQIPPNIFQYLPGYMQQGGAAAGPKWSTTNPFRTVEGAGSFGGGNNASAGQLYNHFNRKVGVDRLNGLESRIADYGLRPAQRPQSFEDFLNRRNPAAPETPAPTDPANPTTPTVPGLPPGFPFNLPPGFQLPQFLQNYMQQQNQPVPEPMPKDIDFSKTIPFMPGSIQQQTQPPQAQTQMNGLMTNFVKPQPTQPLPQGADHGQMNPNQQGFNTTASWSMQAPQVPQFDPSIFNIPQPMPR
jgi:hypothetical protein